MRKHYIEAMHRSMYYLLQRYNYKESGRNKEKESVVEVYEMRTLLQFS